jgi:hypothetical protein
MTLVAHMAVLMLQEMLAELGLVETVKRREPALSRISRR